MDNRPRANHRWLQEHALKRNVVVSKILESFSPHPGSYLIGSVDVMIAIKKNLGLDDGDKPGVLANSVA